MYVAVLWNPGGQTVILKRNMTINTKWYKMTEIQLPRTTSDTEGEVIEIIHKKSAFMFHHNFYPKPKIDLKDIDISQETGQKLLVLQQGYDDIVSKHSSDISLTHLEEMEIDRDPNSPPVTSKPYPLPL